MSVVEHNKSNNQIPSSPLAGEEEFQHELESVRNSGEGYKTAHRKYVPHIKNIARTLRKNSTAPELKLWSLIKNNQLGLKFRRQFPIDNKYIADFVCLEQRLIIEIDGGQHNQNFLDIKRTFYIEQQNFRIIRFWNDEINNNISGCIEYLTNELNTPHPSPNLSEKDTQSFSSAESQGARENAQNYAKESQK